MLNLSYLRSRKGQATTEVVLLFPFFVIFIVFIIKIFGLLVLTQKMEIAGYYAGRRYQLQSHTTDSFANSWDRRYLKKDIQTKVENYLGFNNPGMRKFLSLQDLKMTVDTSSTYIKIKLTARTKPFNIKFLCNYNKDHVCENKSNCLRGYAFLCEKGGEISVIKYVGFNERPLPYLRPESK